MSITVNLVAGTSADNSSISVSGQLQHVITDTEVQSFGLYDSALKKAVGAYFGKQPDDAFLRSPTPWGDLYKTYGWEEVKCTLTPVSAVIRSLDAQPTIVTSQEFCNDSNKTATFSAVIEQNVTQTVTSGWANQQAVSFNQTIEYSAEVLGTGAKGSTSFGATFTFGQSGEDSIGFTVGSSSAVSVVLDPGEAVVANLTCNKGTMKARITFTAVLSGRTAVNYNDGYKDHHYWAMDIGCVMCSGNIQNSLQVVQDLEIGYFSHGHVELKDLNGNDVKAKIASQAVVPGAPWANLIGPRDEPLPVS